MLATLYEIASELFFYLIGLKGFRDRDGKICCLWA